MRQVGWLGSLLLPLLVSLFHNSTDNRLVQYISGSCYRLLGCSASLSMCPKLLSLPPYVSRLALHSIFDPVGQKLAHLVDWLCLFPPDLDIISKPRTNYSLLSDCKASKHSPQLVKLAGGRWPAVEMTSCPGVLRAASPR